jgi:soluble lytic murein transglycosylase
LFKFYRKSLSATFSAPLYRCLLLVGLIMLSTQGQANIEEQRQIFRQAEDALRLNQVSKFKRLLAKIEDYPVQPYLIYDTLRRHINRASNEKVAKFLERYADYPFSYHLRAKWLSTLAKRGDWQNYLTFFDNRDNTRLQCLAFQGRLKLGRVENINEQIKSIWLRGYSQPSECDIAFKYFLETSDEATPAIWLRIEKAFQVRRPNLARYLAKKLDKQGRDIVDLWSRAHKRPEQTLKKLASAEDALMTRTIIAHAIDRLARQNSLKARDTWAEISNKFQFNQQQRNYLAQRIALSAAYQHEPEAQNLLIQLPPELKNDQAYLWLARIQ